MEIKLNNKLYRKPSSDAAVTRERNEFPIMSNSGSISNQKFWLAFWGTIIILLIIYFSAVYKANEISKIKATEDGKQVVLSAEIAEIWEKNSHSIFDVIGDELGSKVKSEIDTLIDETIDAVFTPVYGQIPKFVDFHYSVTGEYTELVDALSGEMGNRVQEILFKQVGFEANLQNEFTAITNLSQEKISGAMGRVNANIQNKIGLSNDDMNILTKTLRLTIQDVKNRFSSLEYSTIRGVGVTLGLTAAGTVLAKAMGKKLAVKVAAKTAVKTSAKAGGVLGGAGAAAGVCVPGGPVAAAACGFAGGVAAWFAVDKLIVEIDEHFNRDEFEQELRSMVDEQKQVIKNRLKNSYSAVLTTLADEQKNKIKSGVVTPKDLISN